MSVIKQYFKDEFNWKMVLLEHPKPSDFYLSCWQTTRSCVPLLILRGALFLASVAIIITSMTFYILNGVFGYWFIYLTHWGLTMVALSTGMATAVSLRCYFYGPIGAEFRLPLYVKVYWVTYNIAVPIALLITVFYWTILYQSGQEEEMDPVLDVFIHGINSVIMFLLLMASAHPTRIFQIYYPLVFAVFYVLFGLIFYLAGGTDQNGNRYVYSVIYWGAPGMTMLYALMTGILMVVLYAVTIGLSLGRDALSNKLVRPSVIVYVDEDLPLRQQPRQTNV